MSGSATRSESDLSINLRWLVRLRWGAIAGQLCTIAVVHFLLRMRLPLAPLGALIAVEVVANLAASALLERRLWMGNAAIAASLALDVLVLSGLLFLTGGSYNPFSSLYLVHIALAAVVLPPRWAWGLVALALACSGALFYGHDWFLGATSSAEAHQAHMRMHLQGMWIACAVAAAFIVHFVWRIRAALTAREADLSAERAAVTRHERLASLATLSAGAAHELATPLGTIAISARELERQIERGRAPAIDDVRLIRAQVDRCRDILDQMAADAGDTPGDEPTRSSVRALLVAASAELAPGSVTVTTDDEGLEIVAPRRAITRALRGLIVNGLHASPPGAAVDVSIAADGADRVRISITDRGSGMAPDVLARAGEPFFTTKPAGKGMGLGLFLARTVVERLGGTLTLESSVGAGTAAHVQLPLAPENPATIRRMAEGA